MPQLATDLLLISRNPATGRLRHRAALEKGLRAALFVELVLARLIVDEQGAPHAMSADPLDDRVLSSVLSTVARKPGVAWRRWFHLVSADRDVLIEALVADGRWLPARDLVGRRGWRDTAQDATLELTHTMLAVANDREPPADREQALLAILMTLCGSVTGRPRPRELRRRLAPLLDAVGPQSDPVRRDVVAVLTGCSTAVRRRRRVLA
jgi:hypothetical protein